MYKRQLQGRAVHGADGRRPGRRGHAAAQGRHAAGLLPAVCLLYTSDAADERSSVDLGGRRIIKKKKTLQYGGRDMSTETKMLATSETHSIDKSNEDQAP